jgi:hypothetical protein
VTPGRSGQDLPHPSGASQLEAKASSHLTGRPDSALLPVGVREVLVACTRQVSRESEGRRTVTGWLLFLLVVVKVRKMASLSDP